MEPRTAEILVRGGIITREQLNEALTVFKQNGSSLVHELVRLGYTSEDQVTDFQQYNIYSNKHYNKRKMYEREFIIA